MADHSIIVELGANISNLTNNLRSANNTLSDFGSRTQQLGADIAKGFGSVGLSIGAGLGFAVKQSADFDSAMRKAGAIAGANTAEFDAMKQSAIELGANTSKSASEVAIAMTELAAKGFDANQVIAAMPGVISAAEASGEDLAMTSDTVSSALNIWGLEASEASRVADVLAESANSTAAGIEDMQYAFKYAGAPAAALGVSMEELSAAIGLMTNAGLKGENAGTALRASMLALLNPSEKNSKMMESMGIAITDAKGNFVGLSGLVDNISKSMEGMTDTQKAANLAALVGTEAVSGFLALMEAGPKKIDEMTASLEGSEGASKKAADQMKAGIGGALEEMSGAIESLVISIGDQLAPAVQTVAVWLSKLLNWFNKMPEGMKKTLVIITAIIGGISLLISGFGLLLGFVGLVSSGLGSLAIALGTTSAAILTTIGVVAGIVLGVIALGAAFVIAYQKVEWFRDMVDAAWAWIKNAFFIALEYIKGVVQFVMADISEFISQQLAKIKAFWDENGKAIMIIVTTAFGIVVEIIKTVMGVIKGVFQVAWPLIVGIIKIAWATIKSVVSTAISLVLGIIQTVMKLIQGDWKGAWETIKSTAKEIWNNIVGYFEGIDLYQIGADIIGGLINGISSMVRSVKNAVSNIGEKIKDGFTSFFDINSPSKVMKKDVGRWIPAGVADGITGNIKTVIAATKEMSKAIMPEAMSATLAYDTPTGSVSGFATVNPSEQVQSESIVNFERMFDGATFNINGEQDALTMARELHRLEQQAKRRKGRR
ncbi:Phage protein [Niallia circulans]|uniref:phage tail tape measure protein n=2 Tax=Niallia circulans TaxID=1397 RepID=UPI00077C0F87|nr:phage tail tape measure protein [Niallia circulans]MDR4318673.1 phage tail tape measure protein [Niallia circulans]MED3839366.1 phage tail tape measure protein [Niallia circulans]MED4245349.1 phage tail tape measure protein [Niallia circulans]MED4250884.1 phage tail tape measure protein [Niallia circulans]QKH60163.1 phage tail tape measure protein [Niallia circulans]